MRLYKFIGYFTGSFIGVILYELIIHYTGADINNWVALILKAITIATAIAIYMALSQRGKNDKPN